MDGFACRTTTQRLASVYFHIDEVKQFYCTYVDIMFNKDDSDDDGISVIMAIVMKLFMGNKVLR